MKKTSVKILERQDLQYIGTNCFGYVGRGYPKPLCILFSDTKGIQWVDTDGSECTGPLNTHCTLPECLEGFERTHATSWK